MADEIRLETIKQLADRVGKTTGHIRTLIAAGKLEIVLVGKRIHIPTDAYPRFIENNRVTKCPEETKAPGSNGLPSAAVSTSSGPNTAAAASAALALRIASRLKRSSENGSRRAEGEAGQLIRLASL